MLARGLVISRLSYLIGIWGGNTQPEKESTDCTQYSGEMGNGTAKTNETVQPDGSGRLAHNS